MHIETPVFLANRTFTLLGKRGFESPPTKLSRKSTVPLSAPAHSRPGALAHAHIVCTSRAKMDRERALSERFSFWRSSDDLPKPMRSGSLPSKPPRQRVRNIFRSERKSVSGADFYPTPMTKTPDGKGGTRPLVQFRAFLSTPRRKKSTHNDGSRSPETISLAHSMEEEKAIASAEMAAQIPHIPNGSVQPVTPNSPEPEPESPHAFKEDGPSGLEFAYVNEDADLPDAPITTFDKHTVALFTAENRIRALQSTIDNFNMDNDKREAEHRAEKVMLQKNVDSFKQQFENASAEIEDLTVQLKDTRKRLSRRVRELEEAMASKNAEAMAAKRADKLTIAQLRAECEILRGGCTEKDIPHGFGPDRPTKSKRAYRKHTVKLNAPESPYSAPALYLDDDHVDQGIARPMSPHLATRAMPPKSPNHRFAADVVRPPSRSSRPMSPGPGAMVRNVTAPNLMLPSEATPRFPRSQSGRSSTSNETHDMSELRRRVSSSQLYSRDGLECARGGRNPKPMDNRCRAARLSLRKAFVANIHASKYRNMRIVWYDFLNAPGSQLTRDQFMQAVRKMPYSSIPQDQDIDLLKDEICGHTRREEAISWAMFVRFYQRTKNEC